MNILSKLITVAATLALAITFVSAGLFACCLPQSTQMLSGAFSKSLSGPFSDTQLMRAALATRDYTVGSHDKAAVMGVISALNKEAATPYAKTSIENLPELPDVYTLNTDALSHLDDVHEVIEKANIAFGIILLVAVALLTLLGLRAGKKRVAGVLIAGGLIVIAVFAGLSAWVINDFDGFFTAFHGLFFAEGSWTFSANSLLITMYPPEFWMGMGLIWLVSTGLLSILAGIGGFMLRRRTH